MAQNQKVSAFSEVTSLNDKDYLMIVRDEGGFYTNKKINAQKLKGADNLTEEYVELKNKDGNLYRVYIDKEGNAKAIKSEAFTGQAPKPEDNLELKYQALIINQMYGGGDNLSGTAVSHSFIELYNLNNTELNLKGLYLWYKSGTGAWENLELVGIIPPYSSFLIRGAAHNSKFKDTCRLKIENYDQEFLDKNGIPKKLAANGMSVYISIGDSIPPVNPPRSLTDVAGATTMQPAYIDLLGCGGKDKSTHTVTAYEKNYQFGMDRNSSCRRIDFYNGGTARDISGYSNGKGDNAIDTEIIDYSTCEVEKYRPRCVADGSWDMFVSAEQYNWNTVNAFVLGYGEKYNTRTFTWQSKVMKEGFVKYRKEGETSFKTIKATTSFIQHPDCSVSKHSAIVRDLEDGIYEYQVGAEGYWSDVDTFKVITYDLEAGDEINILWQSDQQSWDMKEMQTFHNGFNKIINDWEVDENGNPTFDYILETGDISQNGRRRNEYHAYFEGLQGWNKRIPIMSCMGNNDLLEKKFGQCFANFFTNEGQWANSVYHYRLGDVEFIGLNSNTDYDYVAGQGVLGNYQNTDEFLFDQAQWLDRHLTKINSSSDRPRWVICFMHVSPFTNVRPKRVQVFTPIFEKHKVPLVLCGHQHMQSRSYALYTGMPEVTEAGKIQEFNRYYNFNTKSTMAYVDETQLPNAWGGIGINHNEDLRNGTHYVMINANGYKTKGKETKIPEFPEEAVEGFDYNVAGTTEGLAWWNKICETRNVPNYATIKITKDEINIKTYQIEGAKVITHINGKEYEYAPPIEEANLTRTLSDDFTLRLSDRI
jgi:hypothetical protein